MGAVLRHNLKSFWKRCAASALFLVFGFSNLQAAGVVSMDRCADQYVLALLERDQISAVSFEADHLRSFYEDRAKGLPTIDGTLEEVLMLKPETAVLTYRGGPRAAEILGQLGVHVVRPPYSFTMEDSLQVLKTVGYQLGAGGQAEVLAEAYRKRLDRVRQAPKSRLKALYMTPSGFTAGLGTAIDDIIKLAGFDTVAEDVGMKGWVSLPLEKMVLNPPDLVIASLFHDGDLHVSHWAGGRHGVYKRLMQDIPTLHVPSKFLTCNGVYAIDAADYIRAEAERRGLMKRTGDDH